MGELAEFDKQLDPRLVVNAGSDIDMATGMSGSAQMRAVQVRKVLILDTKFTIGADWRFRKCREAIGLGRFAHGPGAEGCTGSHQ